MRCKSSPILDLVTCSHSYGIGFAQGFMISGFIPQIITQKKRPSLPQVVVIGTPTLHTFNTKVQSTKIQLKLEFLGTQTIVHTKILNAFFFNGREI